MPTTYQKKHIPIDGYQQYTIDTDGTVYNNENNPIKYSVNNNGIKTVVLVHATDMILSFIGVKERRIKKRQIFQIPILLAKTFIPNDCTEKKFVWYKDGNSQNTNIENLIWVTQSELWNLKKKAGLINSKSHVRKPVQCTTYNGTTIEFKSIAAAGEYLKEKGIVAKADTAHKVLVSKLASKQGQSISYGGCTWQYIEKKHKPINITVLDDMTPYKAIKHFKRNIKVDIIVKKTNEIIPFDCLTGAVKFLAYYYPDIIPLSFVVTIKKEIYKQNDFDFRDVIIRQNTQKNIEY